MPVPYQDSYPPLSCSRYCARMEVFLDCSPIIYFVQDGKELGRVPAIVNGKVQKFFFKEEDIVNAFDLNNLYKKCKEDKKFVPFDQKEAKKDK